MRSAIAAFRGMRPFRKPKKEQGRQCIPKVARNLCGPLADDACIVVMPKLDGRIRAVGVPHAIDTKHKKGKRSKPRKESRAEVGEQQANSGEDNPEKKAKVQPQEQQQ